MHRAVAALSWEIFARHHGAFTAATLYLGVIGVIVPLLPEGWRGEWLPAALMCPFYPLFPFALGVVMHGDSARLETTASAFPARLFLLPVPSVVLAGVPLLVGTLGALVWWLALATCVFRPCGMSVPLLWPALLIASCVAWLQALSWSPVPLPWLRVALLCIIPLGWVVGMKEGILDFGFQDTEVALPLTGLLLAGYATAVAGVARGRRGVGVGDVVQQGPVEDIGAGYAPFRSPLVAQLWLEYRALRWGVLMATAVGVGAAIGATHLWWVALHKRELFHLSPWIMAAVGRLGPAWLALGFMLLVPWLFALTSGSDLGRLTLRPGGHGISTFRATMPISTRDMVRAKLLATAGVALFTWGCATLTAFAWALATGQVGDMAERLSAATGSPLRAALALAGGVAALVVFSWLWMVRNLWGGLSGRLWLVWVPVTLDGLLLISLVALVTYWRAEWSPFLAGAVVAGLVLKAATVVLVIASLRRRSVLEPGDLPRALTVWAVVAAPLAWAAGWWLPGGIVALGLTVLLLPLARCLAAPLALAYNRHR